MNVPRSTVLIAAAAAATLGIAGCSSTSESVDSSGTNAANKATAPTPGQEINNVVYFGNPATELPTLANYKIKGTGTAADGTNFVDTVVLFAANIDDVNGKPAPPPAPQPPTSAQDPLLVMSEFTNSTAGAATVPADPTVLAGVNALHAAGIKVLLGVLPNHYETGWSCPGMTSTAQQSLANQLATVTAANSTSNPSGYGFDGISIDDEYSECPSGNELPGGDVGVITGILTSLKANPQFAGKTINKSLYSDTNMFPPASSKQPNLAPLLNTAWTETYPGYSADLSTYLLAGVQRQNLGRGEVVPIPPATPPGNLTTTGKAVASDGLKYMMIYGGDEYTPADSPSGTPPTPYTPAQRAAFYTSVVQGTFNSSSASVTYNPPASPKKKS